MSGCPYVLLATGAHYCAAVLRGLVDEGLAPAAVLLADPGGTRPHGAPVTTLPVRTRSVIENLSHRHHIELLRLSGPDHRPFEVLAGRGVRLGVVACFPWRLDDRARAALPLGFLNLHPSLLPAWRGPTPLQWQRHHREPYTGVSIHRVDAGLDTGAVLAQTRHALDPTLPMQALETLLGRSAAGLLCALLRAPGELPAGAPQAQADASRQPVFVAR